MEQRGESSLTFCVVSIERTRHTRATSESSTDDDGRADDDERRGPRPPRVRTPSCQGVDPTRREHTAHRGPHTLLVPTRRAHVRPPSHGPYAPTRVPLVRYMLNLRKIGHKHTRYGRTEQSRARCCARPRTRAYQIQSSCELITSTSTTPDPLPSFSLCRLKTPLTCKGS